MGRRSLADADSRWRIGQPTRTSRRNYRADDASDLERRFFEFDRSLVLGVLNTLQDAIHNGAAQFQRVADNGDFSESLSAAFSRTAQQLTRSARRLEKVLQGVANAHGYPESPILSRPRRASIRRLHSRRA